MSNSSVCTRIRPAHTAPPWLPLLAVAVGIVGGGTAAAGAPEPEAGIVIEGIERQGAQLRLEIGYPASFTNHLDVFVCADLEAAAWTLAAMNLPTPEAALAWTDEVAAGPGPRFYVVGDADLDSDGDGLSDARELLLYRTDPFNVDTDGDGLADGYSGVVRAAGVPGGVPLGGSEFVEGELTWGTSAANADSDGDGTADGVEVRQGRHPDAAVLRAALHLEVVTPLQ